ncbi:MAG: penicillin-binding protein 1C [Kangiellaceae bacterium]|nr:penicillin-binding protein 1C [Kangiellaceae bacterium]
MKVTVPKDNLLEMNFLKSRFRRTCLSMFILFLLAGLGLVFCPKPELKLFQPYSKAYFDSNGELLRIKLAKDERYRLHLPLESISSQLIQATILYEDQEFYDHFGVDVTALFRAFWSTYISGERRIGASTIVMQLARLRWNIPSHTFSGKITQLVRAVQLSRHYTKKQLLEAYFNTAPYGRNIEGVGAASLIYFNKKPIELSLPEVLTLAVIPQNPNKRNPTTDKGFSKLQTARNVLFERWITHHPTDIKQAKYLSMPMNVRPPESLPFLAPHFIPFIDKQLSNWQSEYVETTLNLAHQQLMERVVNRFVIANNKKGIRNASALLVNYQTNQIEAMVGSADFFDSEIQGQVNGTTAKRSPGSALKPFVYALALDEGLIHPMSLLKDSPRKYGGFTPENYDKRFLGPISATRALVESRNVPAVDLQAQLNKMSFYEFLAKAHITNLQDESHYGLALALGGGEVTSIELASLYAMLANRGKWRSIQGLTQQESKFEKNLLSAEASFLTLDMLKDNPAPDQFNAAFNLSNRNETPWKTGTSWAYRDAWAVGISGPYVLVVWVGNFDGKGNDSFIGRSAAGPLFFKLWDAIYPAKNWKLADQLLPDSMNLKRLKVCSNTGDLYEKHCPSVKQSWFIPGVSPIKVSNIYRSIPINKKSGLRACWSSQNTEQEIFEFWPTELLQIYNKAGLSLKSPPAFEQDCTLNLTSASGVSPIISSPQSRVDYVVRMNSTEPSKIPLVASVDHDVSNMHWFVNSEYIGSAKVGETLFWPSRPGEFSIKVVDDSGRSMTKGFKVITESR